MPFGNRRVRLVLSLTLFSGATCPIAFVAAALPAPALLCPWAEAAWRFAAHLQPT